MKSRTDAAFSLPPYPKLPGSIGPGMSEELPHPQLKHSRALMEAGLSDGEIAERLDIMPARIAALRRYYGLYHN
ncbi:hypothetical protein ACFOW6_00695 [Fodinicurvata halophila]|uniref:Uncharacterized protein n=1 Tax=Fodinicurvata halophila TaxID=1419723 RepID=A0ABV8UHH2_9PROT